MAENEHETTEIDRYSDNQSPAKKRQRRDLKSENDAVDKLTSLYNSGRLQYVHVLFVRFMLCT